MKEFIVRWMMQIFKQDFQCKEYDQKKMYANGNFR